MSSDGSARALSAAIAVRDNIALISEWSAGHDLDALKASKLLRYAIERAFIAIDAAIRDIPKDELATEGVNAAVIAGFRNILAHTYDDILDERVMLTIKEDLPALDAAMLALIGRLG